MSNVASYASMDLFAFYEMLFLIVAFRDQSDWHLIRRWSALIVLCCGISTLGFRYLQHLPTVFIWTIPIVLITTLMGVRLLHIHWILMLLITMCLNTGKRLIMTLLGILIKWHLQLSVPVFIWQLHPASKLAVSDVAWAVVIELPIILLLATWTYRGCQRIGAVKFLQRAVIHGGDYILVLLLTTLYMVGYSFVYLWPMGLQVYVTVVFLLLFAAFSYYLITSKNSHLNDEQLLDAVVQYNTLLSQRNRELHLFKHDYQNILLSLSAYIRKEDMVGLKNYFDHEIKSQPVSESLGSPDALRHLQSPALSGLIYAKYQDAARRHVELRLFILETIEVPPVSQMGAVRILGNLLDNAIDAATKTDQLVQLTIHQLTTGEQHFIVTNRIAADTTVNLNQIRRNRFTTKPGHRGYGLSSIAQLSTSQLFVTYQLQDQQFMATMVIKANES